MVYISINCAHLIRVNESIDESINGALVRVNESIDGAIVKANERIDGALVRANESIDGALVKLNCYYLIFFIFLELNNYFHGAYNARFNSCRALFLPFT